MDHPRDSERTVSRGLGVASSIALPAFVDDLVVRVELAKERQRSTIRGTL